MYFLEEIIYVIVPSYFIILIVGILGFLDIQQPSYFRTDIYFCLNYTA